jgi:hypothetical protein
VLWEEGSEGGYLMRHDFLQGLVQLDGSVILGVPPLGVAVVNHEGREPKEDRIHVAAPRINLSGGDQRSHHSASDS